TARRNSTSPGQPRPIPYSLFPIPYSLFPIPCRSPFPRLRPDATLHSTPNRSHPEELTHGVNESVSRARRHGPKPSGGRVLPAGVRFGGRVAAAADGGGAPGAASPAGARAGGSEAAGRADHAGRYDASAHARLS